MDLKGQINAPTGLDNGSTQVQNALSRRVAETIWACLSLASENGVGFLSVSL